MQIFSVNYVKILGYVIPYRKPVTSYLDRAAKALNAIYLYSRVLYLRRCHNRTHCFTIKAHTQTCFSLSICRMAGSCTCTNIYVWLRGTRPSNNVYISVITQRCLAPYIGQLQADDAVLRARALLYALVLSCWMHCQYSCFVGTHGCFAPSRRYDFAISVADSRLGLV